MVNVADVEPAGIVRLAGAVATGLSQSSATVAPPASAAEVSLTVPVLVDPAVTRSGLRASELS